jgi:hypothetical protein
VLWHRTNIFACTFTYIFADNFTNTFKDNCANTIAAYSNPYPYIPARKKSVGVNLEQYGGAGLFFHSRWYGA